MGWSMHHQSMNGVWLLKMAMEDLDQESILDKIRAEIEKLDGNYVIGDYGIYGGKYS